MNATANESKKHSNFKVLCLQKEIYTRNADDYVFNTLKCCCLLSFALASLYEALKKNI